MEANALPGQLDGKRGGMWTLCAPIPDGAVGDEPGVATTPAVPFRRGPARHVGLVLILHSDGQAVERDPSRLGEMEHELVAVIQEPGALDRLEMAHGDVPVHPGIIADILLLYGDGLDPVDDVLEVETLPHFQGDLERDPGVRGLAPDVQKD